MGVRVATRHNFSNLTKVLQSDHQSAGGAPEFPLSDVLLLILAFAAGGICYALSRYFRNYNCKFIREKSRIQAPSGDYYNLKTPDTESQLDTREMLTSLTTERFPPAVRRVINLEDSGAVYGTRLIHKKCSLQTAPNKTVHDICDSQSYADILSDSASNSIAFPAHGSPESSQSLRLHRPGTEMGKGNMEKRTL